MKDHHLHVLKGHSDCTSHKMSGSKVHIDIENENQYNCHKVFWNLKS